MRKDLVETNEFGEVLQFMNATQTLVRFGVSDILTASPLQLSDFVAYSLHALWTSLEGLTFECNSTALVGQARMIVRMARRSQDCGTRFILVF